MTEHQLHIGRQLHRTQCRCSPKSMGTAFCNLDRRLLALGALHGNTACRHVHVSANTKPTLRTKGSHADALALLSAAQAFSITPLLCGSPHLSGCARSDARRKFLAHPTQFGGGCTPFPAAVTAGAIWKLFKTFAMSMRVSPAKKRKHFRRLDQT